jgi:hypothetical protein
MAHAHDDLIGYLALAAVRTALKWDEKKEAKVLAATSLLLPVLRLFGSTLTLPAIR